MRGWFYTTEPNLVIGDLTHHFEPQVRLMVYDRLNEFYTLKMEEHTSVGLHLAKVHRIHRHLILEFNHEIPGPLANGAVLRSLPPSYRSFVEDFVMGGESVTFHELVPMVRSLKVESSQGEIVDPTGICDIQCYKCFINTYAVLKYVILIPVLWKQDLWNEVFVEETAMAPRGGYALCLLTPIYLNIYLQVFRIWIKFCNQFYIKRSHDCLKFVRQSLFVCNEQVGCFNAMNKVFLDDYE
jgi:hypothetical protein